MFQRLMEEKEMKNPMKACSACGVEIAKSAKACPHCGAKNKKPIYKKWWFWLIIIFILIGALGSSSDEPEHPEEDASAVVSDIIPETADTEEKSTVDETKNSEIFIDNEIKEKQTEIETKPDDSAGLSISQINALASAKSYLSFSAFSHQGLVDQLEFEKFSTEDAVFAADHCGADWDEQALKSAKSYLGFSAFSYSGLIDQLEFEGFTPEQATYGADNCGADWNEQAAKSAKSYLEFSSFSRDGLIDQLEFEGFTHEQAVYGVEANGF